MLLNSRFWLTVNGEISYLSENASITQCWTPYSLWVASSFTKKQNIPPEDSPEPSEAANMPHCTASGQVSALLHALLCGLIYSAKWGSHSTSLIRIVLRTEFDNVRKIGSQCLEYSVSISGFLACFSWNHPNLASSTQEMCGKCVSGWVNVCPAGARVSGYESSIHLWDLKSSCQILRTLSACWTWLTTDQSSQTQMPTGPIR